MSFFLTSSVILSYDNFYFAISQLFGNWKLEFQDVRDSLVGNIMSQVRNIVESNKGYCGVLELSVVVKLVSRDDVIEERISFPGEDLSSEYGVVWCQLVSHLCNRY
ncbi:hypothetical protein MTR67_007898 [Solanum verrucosum]|uniref:Uncharacterized protein n=1 Tax=Solanum verrucosum TaxID=315347 RepID=A0AAF0TFY5_SOLVR|nr:hypothetical protein MTR67_007898 [Solanum verrucosum]